MHRPYNVLSLLQYMGLKISPRVCLLWLTAALGCVSFWIGAAQAQPVRTTQTPARAHQTTKPQLPFAKTVWGQFEGFNDGYVVLSEPISPGKAAMYQQMGYRRVEHLRLALHRRIYRDRVFHAYRIGETIDPKLLKHRVGQRVQALLRRRADGTIEAAAVK